ncbi:MAG: polymerase, sigma 28 subunit, FliA/WhiG subfamily [Herbinix sp.]|nr:polymerase, sigma 28 subunit, FliA/WhiG subfamily [Herbinix sp.]
MRELDALVIKAKKDHQLLEELIKQNEFYILKTASKVTHRYITKSDDEWSIALLAYSQAIQHYEYEKGSFFSFAELLIKRRLIDYHKSQVKYNPEVSVDPIVFDTEPDEEDEDIPIKMAVAEQVSIQNNKDLKYEIEAANKCFSVYGFTFMELSKCSPHAKKTRKACSEAINYLLINPVLINELRCSKQLPIKMIENNCKIPRKIIERHRKYIIAAIEILSGEYPYLAEYLRYIREENKL